MLASAGLFAIVYGFSRAATSAWTSTLTLGALVGGVVLLIGFVGVQQRVAHPLLPLRVILDRNRGGSYVSVAISAAAIFGFCSSPTTFSRSRATARSSPVWRSCR